MGPRIMEDESRKLCEYCRYALTLGEQRCMKHKVPIPGNPYVYGCGDFRNMYPED